MRRTPATPALLILGALLVLAVAPRFGRADAPRGRYTVMGGTVLDAQTQLTWQEVLDTNKHTSQGATMYCTSLPLGGGGWRVPSEGELATLVDESTVSPAIATKTFPNTPKDFFWTSSVVPQFPQYTWALTFDTGQMTLLAGSEPQWVRCVRP